VLVRVATANEVDSDLLSDLEAVARGNDYSDYLILCQGAASPALAGNPHVLAGPELERWMRSSWILRHQGKGVVVDRASWELNNRLLAIDRVATQAGLLRLAVASSRNVVPRDFRGYGTADDLFEQSTFAILTQLLLLEGRRMGSSARGQRVGDALVGTIDRDRPVLVDCKAAANGYLMGIDDERRLLEYAQADVAWRGKDVKPSRVLIVTSEFGTDSAGVRSFSQRRSKFQAVGSELAYVRIADMVDIVITMPTEVWDDTESRRGFDWCVALNEGLVSRASLMQVVQG
jgi:hypothetical protein